MATLNLSAEGPAINKSYQSVVNAPAPSGPAASSPTYGQWAVYAVSAPLVNAFQQDSGKESVLKVQSTGEGELEDLIEDFSDGRIQFAFVKVKDPNSKLPKSVLIAWCGEGVPERTKGYFTSHLAAVSKILHGYHIQVTARSDRDLTPDSIIRKVADSSGSKYSGDSAPASSGGGPPPPIASKPVFTPKQYGGGTRGFNPLGQRSGATAGPSASGPTDDDGWGSDAPQVTRTQLEKVAPAYKPTRVNMNDLTSQKSEPSRISQQQESPNGNPDVVKGGYQPIGKVDIAAIRRQAQESGQVKDDRPTVVKGSYEPVGKVDIAAIRARAQPSSDAAPQRPEPVSSSIAGDDADDRPKSLADRSAAFTQSERLTTLPKPKVANRFGAGASSFTGTKAPTPSAFGVAPAPAPIGGASKNFANEGGKTPAQIWAEKKARERGNSAASETYKPGPASPVASQTSGGGQWESGYTGKKWGEVQTTRTGLSSTGAVSEHATGENAPTEDDPEPTGNVSAIRDRFKNAAPMGAAATGFDDDEAEPALAPPPMNLASKPGAGAVRGVPMPGLPQKTPAEEEMPDEESNRMPTPPPQPPRSATPPTPPAMDSGSPIRIAQPVGRDSSHTLEPADEQFSPTPLPIQSIANAVPAGRDLEPEPQSAHEDIGRGAGQATAASTFGASAAASANATAGTGGQRALVQYDYEKAEENEIELREGSYVTNIDMVDEDWWMGENEHGEKGLFPANYVELVEDEEPADSAPAAVAAVPPPVHDAAPAASAKPSAIAQYDYEAAESNELSFPDGALITNIEFPDDDWWLGEYNGHQGLFPANYVQLEE